MTSRLFAGGPRGRNRSPCSRWMPASSVAMVFSGTLPLARRCESRRIGSASSGSRSRTSPAGGRGGSGRASCSSCGSSGGSSPLHKAVLHRAATYSLCIILGYDRSSGLRTPRMRVRWRGAVAGGNHGTDPRTNGRSLPCGLWHWGRRPVVSFSERELATSWRAPHRYSSF